MRHFLISIFFSGIIGFIIQVQQGNNQLSSQMTEFGEILQWISLPKPFLKTPAISLSILEFGYIQQEKTMFQTYVYNLTNTGFSLVIQASQLTTFSVNYLVFDEEDYGFTIFHNQSSLQGQDWSLGPLIVHLAFEVNLTYIPQHAIFLNGLSIELGNEHNVDLQVVSISESGMDIQIASSPVNVLSWVTICIVVGKPELFYGVQDKSVAVPNMKFSVPPYATKYFKEAYLVGFSGYYSQNKKGIRNKIYSMILSGNKFTALASSVSSSLLLKMSASLIVIRSGCILTCATCSTEQKCLSCDKTRNLDVQKAECYCALRFFENNPIKTTCNPCNANCLTCVTKNTTCTSCDRTTFRTLSNQECICIDGYYLDSKNVCNECSSTCLTCASSPQKCLSCSKAKFRNLDVLTSECHCNIGYFEKDLICLNCNPKCQSCTESADNCTSCDKTNYRVKDVQIANSTICICDVGYYQTEAQICRECILACKTCVDQSYKCTSCNVELNLLYDEASNKCYCRDIGYDYNTADILCQNDDIEILQLKYMNQEQRDQIYSVREFTQKLFNRDEGEGYYFYILRRTSLLQLVATFDQQIAQFHYLNITYPLQVFELEKLLSLFVFDYLQNYIQPNDEFGYTLFLHDIEQDINPSTIPFNYQRVEVTSLFILTGIDVIFVGALYIIFSIVVLYCKKRNSHIFKEDEKDDMINLYRITEDIGEQERQWVSWQVKTYLRSQLMTDAVLDFLFFWFLENKNTVFFASLLMQLSYPTFDTALQISSFLFAIATLMLVLYFHLMNLYRFRSIIQKRLLLKQLIESLQQRNTDEQQLLANRKQKQSAITELPSSEYVEMNTEQQLREYYIDLLTKLDAAIKIQFQRYSSDVKLDSNVYSFHGLNLLKKMAFAMVCLYGFGKGLIQLWILFAISVVFLIPKLIFFPYNSIMRNVLVIICDLLYITILILKVNDLHNHDNFTAATTVKEREKQVQIFIDQGRITSGVEIAFIALSLLLQFFIFVTYILRWNRCNYKPKDKSKPRRRLNLDVYGLNDFRRLLIELNNVEQVRVLGNMTQVFRDGDILLDEFLEVTYIFTYTHRVVNQNQQNYLSDEFETSNKKINVQGHYSIQLKNANAKATLVIYQIQRDLISKYAGIDQTTSLKDNIQLELPISLQPFQACYMHQYFQIQPRDTNRILKLAISYQRVVDQKKHQNLVIVETQLAASISLILKNVDILEDEAQDIFKMKETSLIMQGNSSFVTENQKQIYWSLVTQYLGFIIQLEGQRQKQILLAKFILPEIDSRDQQLLDIYLIVEKEEPATISLQVWHKRFGQFTTYNNTRLYQSIMDNLLNGLVNFFQN